VRPLSAFLPPDYNPARPLTLIAGQGLYPQLVARAVRAAGVPLRLVAFEEETPPELIESFAPGHRRLLKVGQLGHMLDALRDFEAGYAYMAGQITPRRLFRGLHPDFKATRILLSLKRRNAETIFGAIAQEIEALGVTLLDARAFLDDQLATAGGMTGRRFPIDDDYLATASRSPGSAPASTSARVASCARAPCSPSRPSKARMRCCAGRAHSRPRRPSS
jgi:DUF1009 family protein